MTREELRAYHVEAAAKLRSYADDPGLRESDTKHYTKRAAFHDECVAVIDTLLEERDFLLAQFREMAQAKPYAMVELSQGPHQRTPEVDPYKWFWWNGEARPIYKGALCDVVLSDGSIHFNVRPGFDWSGYGDVYVIAARHGPNLDGMEDVDRPAAHTYAAPISPGHSCAAEPADSVVLPDEQFDQVTELLETNPLELNLSAQRLLRRKRPWSGS